MPIGEEPRRGEIGRAAAGDHIARDGPRRAAKTEHGAAWRQLRLDARYRLEDRREPRKIDLTRQALEPFGATERLEP